MFLLTSSPSARAFIPSSVIWQALRLSSARLGRERCFNMSWDSFTVPAEHSAFPSKCRHLHKIVCDMTATASHAQSHDYCTRWANLSPSLVKWLSASLDTWVSLIPRYRISNTYRKYTSRNPKLKIIYSWLNRSPAELLSFSSSPSPALWTLSLQNQSLPAQENIWYRVETFKSNIIIKNFMVDQKRPHSLPWISWGVSKVGGVPGYETGSSSETWCCRGWRSPGQSVSACPSTTLASCREAVGK